LDLGPVYGVEVSEDGCVRVNMTLTKIRCIFTHRVFVPVYDAPGALLGGAEVEVVPVWNDERLNDKAQRALAESKSAMFRTIGRRGL
jgi:metal-sulfur cluster biosynthetic enzyme